VVKLADDDGRSWVLRASAERAKEAEERDRIQKIVDAVAERRARDFMDLIAVTEQREGWSNALDCLRKASDKDYQSPMGTRHRLTRLEPLKYREIVFELFSCVGLEPVSCDTMILLDELEDEKSMVTATSRFSQRVNQLAIDQVSSGDTLFFDFSSILDSKREAASLLEEMRTAEIRMTYPMMQERDIELRLLWLTETGRRLLSELGVKGYEHSEIDTGVLSVIQTILGRTWETANHEPNLRVIRTKCEKPSNSTYSHLLQSMVDQDEEGLRSLGSRYSLPTLDFMLYSSVTSYEKTESSDDYRRLVRCTGNHIAVRALDSVKTIAKIARMDDSRISTLAIAALSNFYHESAASVLIDIVCKTSTKEILDISLSALNSILGKSPEARHLLSRTVHSEQPNRGRLRNVYRRMPRGLPDWYYLE